MRINMRAAIYSLKEMAQMIKERQQNEFDATICVSGARGNGKSTLIWKLFKRLKGFKPKIHMVYSRKDVMHLLDTQRYGLIFDDEAIRSGYRRNFFEEDQKKLIEMLTMYRDNQNIYAMAMPKFYRLDKDLRDLIKIHIHITRRGWGVIHMSRDDVLYSDDPWDSSFNAKLEQKWLKRLKKNPDWKIPYHRLTTFVGYIEFQPMLAKDEIIYKQLKREKRQVAREEEAKEGEKKTKEPRYDILIKMLLEGRVNQDALMSAAALSGMPYANLITRLNERLKSVGENRTVSKLFGIPNNPKNLQIENKKNGSKKIELLEVLNPNVT